MEQGSNKTKRKKNDTGQPLRRGVIPVRAGMLKRCTRVDKVYWWRPVWHFQIFTGCDRVGIWPGHRLPKSENCTTQSKWRKKKLAVLIIFFLISSSWWRLAFLFSPYTLSGGDGRTISVHTHTKSVVRQCSLDITKAISQTAQPQKTRERETRNQKKFIIHALMRVYALHHQLADCKPHIFLAFNSRIYSLFVCYCEVAVRACKLFWLWTSLLFSRRPNVWHDEAIRLSFIYRTQYIETMDLWEQSPGAACAATDLHNLKTMISCYAERRKKNWGKN